MNEFVVTSPVKKTEILLQDNNEVIIDGLKHEYELISLDTATYILKIDKHIFHLSARKENGDRYIVYVNGNSFDLVVRNTLQEKAIKEIEQAAAGKKISTIIKAPMPGMILKVKKKAGDTVLLGESVIILEAMKMENDIHSPATGVLKTIFASEGNAVEKGAVLFTIE